MSDDLTMPKCPGHACDHVLCIEQRRVLGELGQLRELLARARKWTVECDCTSPVAAEQLDMLNDQIDAALAPQDGQR
jgi:hypothetical protein